MKKRVYILHGWAYDTKKWEPFLHSLSQSGIDATVLSVPGLTASLDRVWTLDDYVEWLHTILFKEKSPVVLFGHSNGGRICLAYVLRYPEKVKKLFLLDSAGIYHNELPLRIKRVVFGFLAKTGKKLSQSELLRGLLYRFAREKDYQKANPVLRKTMRNLITVDLSSRLSEIIVPTVIIWGAFDKATPLGDGELLHKKISGSVLHVIAGARHSPQFTHTQEVADILVDAID